MADGLEDANVSDVVRVGEQHLIGEILNMTGGSASIQVYEETSGLGPGAEVVTTGMPLSVELGPGMLENIYDGIQRPLTGDPRSLPARRSPAACSVPALNREEEVGLRPYGEGGRRARRRRRARHRAGDDRHPAQDHGAPDDRAGHRQGDPSRRRIHRRGDRSPCLTKRRTAASI